MGIFIPDMEMPKGCGGYTQEAENTQIYVTHWMPLPEPPEDDA